MRVHYSEVTNQTFRDRIVYYRNGNGIRGLACLIVLIAHSMGFFHPAHIILFKGSGRIGVWLFFVLSAFLLTHQSIQKELNRRFIIHYVASRFLRIVPLYVIACVVYYFCGSANIQTGADLLNALLLQHGFAHLWTVPVEMKFYCILPLIMAITLYAWKRLGLATGIAVMLAIFGVSAFAFPYYIMKR